MMIMIIVAVFLKMQLATMDSRLKYCKQPFLGARKLRPKHWTTLLRFAETSISITLRLIRGCPLSSLEASVLGGNMPQQVVWYGMAWLIADC